MVQWFALVALPVTGDQQVCVGRFSVVYLTPATDATFACADMTHHDIPIHHSPCYSAVSAVSSGTAVLTKSCKRRCEHSSGASVPLTYLHDAHDKRFAFPETLRSESNTVHQTVDLFFDSLPVFD